MTRSARRELMRAAAWYDQQRAGLGDELLDEVAVGLGLLKEFPEASPAIAGSIRRLLLRRFPYGLIYYVDSDEIAIVAVAHNHRRPRYWSKRLARNRR